MIERALRSTNRFLFDQSVTVVEGFGITFLAVNIFIGEFWLGFCVCLAALFVSHYGGKITKGYR
jgi:hypothetical protein